MSRIMILPGTNRKSGTSKAGKPYEFVEVEAVRLDTGPYPDKFTLSFKPDNVPAPGEYDVDWAASIYVNKRDFNRLAIGDLKLAPASADAKPRAVAG